MKLELPKLPSPDKIQDDIDRLKANAALCHRNIASLKGTIKQMRREQRKLKALVDDPGPYDPESLRSNIDKIGDDIVKIKATMNAESNKIKEFDRIIEDLKDRKCRSEAILRLNGSRHQES